MTHKDFNALAYILSDHLEELRSVDTDSTKANAVAFSRLMSSMRAFCRERNPNFDGSRFDSAVYDA